jgi:UDP-2,4-diacetamido-2,4,6-trideoxy-beta-L-altropyranose hydrolase
MTQTGKSETKSASQAEDHTSAAGIGRLVIRADASVRAGIGHVMRCLALAQAWRDAGGQALFVMSQPPPAIQDRLCSERIEVTSLPLRTGQAEEVRWLSEAASRHRAEWVVVDGYQFGADYQRALKDAGLKILFLDDYGHSEHYCADLVLNQNAHAQEDFYRNRAAGTRLLLGPRYALLRREFLGCKSWKRAITPVGRKVLVTLGGSDPDNVTLRVIEALRLLRIEGLSATVVVGGANPHMKSLAEAVSDRGGIIRLVQNAPNMPELMAWADLAVAGAGSTCWEMSLLGLPSLLVDQAENQVPIAHKLDEMGVARHLGGCRDVRPAGIAAQLERLLLSADERAAMSRRGRELVDGEGAQRVVRELQQH